MAAKKAPKRAQADQPATEPCGTVEPSTDGEATKTLTPVPAAEVPTTNDSSDRLRLLQLVVDTAGRIFHALTSWLTHDQPHMRVLGWITWLSLLGMVAVVVSREEFLYTIAAISGLTGLVAGVNTVSRNFRGRR